MEKKKQSTLSIVVEDFILREIELFRRAQMRRTGHLSRSNAIRMLVSRGLDAISAEQPEKDGQAQA